MKFPVSRHERFIPPKDRGFALVSTLMLMILLVIVAVGVLSLSTVTLRSNSQSSAQAQAQANARMALMIAIGELQKEMGPDMRVSAESALLDSDISTANIEGVAQSHWLSSYNSWGDWLNANYTPPGGSPLTISDTYQPRRATMFRRWLLSLPTGKETDITAPLLIDDWNDTNSVVLVGKSSLGDSAQADQITRAYLTSIDETRGITGKYAWWISPENHKALINRAKNPRTLSTDQWQTAQGDTTEVGVGGLTGFNLLDNDQNLSKKLFSYQTLAAAEVDKNVIKKYFHDLTSNSQGVLTSVRSGHLKKDLSLLLEKDNANLPAPYKFNVATDVREPSIRPMSPELAAKNPQVAGRHFQSWTNLRHYYRMYRQGSDATVKAYGNSAQVASGGGIGGSGNLTWAANGPYTDMVSTANFCDRDLYSRWTGSNSYWRVPIIAKITFIYSLQTSIRNPGPPVRYDHNFLYTPVYTLWNPYNVRMQIPDQQLVFCSSAYPTIPTARELYTNNTFLNEGGINPSFGNYGISYLRSSAAGTPIIFEPGEFRVFSYSSAITGGTQPFNLYPGFDPQSMTGDVISVVNNQPASYNPGIAMRVWFSEWGGNINAGNTAGSINVIQNWAVSDPRNQTPSLPIAYQNDWFNVSQQREYVTPSPRPANFGAINRWNYADRGPKPIAYIQMALKGQAQSDYESITWEKDWRSRNWISSPPFYFGHGMYASEDAKTLHTQRMENPYVMNFGPTSMAELPKIVFVQGTKAFLGSGSNPFEKVNQVASVELPTAPISSLASFSGMRINPGWSNVKTVMPHLFVPSTGGDPRAVRSFYGA